MVEIVKPEKVIVDRHGEKFEAHTHHCVFADIPDEKGNPTKGPLLGIGVQQASGHILYAQPAMLAPAEKVA
jgi:hypothetical protein